MMPSTTPLVLEISIVRAKVNCPTTCKNNLPSPERKHHKLIRLQETYWIDCSTRACYHAMPFRPMLRPFMYSTKTNHLGIGWNTDSLHRRAYLSHSLNM